MATFRFAAPAFEASEDAVFVENPVLPEGVGTLGFARAHGADGVTPIADFSAGSGNTEIGLSEVSTTPGYPVSVTRLRLNAG